MEGASWDRYRVCLEHTRHNIINTIIAWLNIPSSAGHDKRIFLLIGVAGSGKSTIAHTVAQRCETNGQLATSFFFDRNTGDRNNPRYVISTMAADLCQADPYLARRIQDAIDDDERILYAPISRQFEHLILKPCDDFSAEHPLCIVLDALDEGSNSDLLRILCDDAHLLPRSIRIFLTSRMSPEIETLRRRPHVHSMSLDIYDRENMSDIAYFVPYKLKQVADQRGLGADWPDKQLATLFQTKSEGLFLWVAITCDYLKTCYYPEKELEKLVSAPISTSSAESKMDKLYATILSACNWNDRDFAKSCHRLLGAAVATKTPLTMRALNSLYQCILMESDSALQELSPLLSGLGNEQHACQPVRFLHQSLRDFLTQRAGSPGAPEGSNKFAIDEMEHNQTLALLCLTFLNHKLNCSTPGVGYLANDGEEPSGIPSVDQSAFDEDFWYASHFWFDHLLDNDTSTVDILAQLQLFISTKITLWMELMAACGQYEGLSRLQEWAKVSATVPFRLSSLKVITAISGSA